MIDIHCHILPGIDDGPRNLAESLALCRMLVQDGVDIVVATPHMLNGVYPTTRELVLEKLTELKSVLLRENIDLQIVPGADIHVHAELDQYIKNREVLTIGDQGKFFLLELPNQVWLKDLEQIIFSIQLLNITPIITHPERIPLIQKDISLLTPLVEKNILIQITAASIAGDFGKSTQKCSRKLFEAGLAHLVATDAHGATKRPPRLTKARKQIADWMGKEQARIIFETRPQKILAGEYIAVPPINKNKLRRRLFF